MQDINIYVFAACMMLS